jgi:hypothetical protein
MPSSGCLFKTSLMAPTYGAISLDKGAQETPRGRIALRSAVLALFLSVAALVVVASQLDSADPAALAEKAEDINTYGAWLNTLGGKASPSGIDDETADFGKSQNNDKSGESELFPSGLPASAKIAQMEGSEFAKDVVCS